VRETSKERLNRNLDQLLQELRVVLPGVQVLFAFLLAVPFATRFDRVDRFERVVFFIALLIAALAVILLLAPSIQHRILFRHDQKRYLVHVGTVLTIAGMTALACSMTLSLVLIAHFLYGLWAALIVAGCAIVAFGVVWYALPIGRRRGAGPPRDDPDEEPAPAVPYPPAP
jgi:FtsH-binding integral membrane protein